jgi:hypothetical protein
MANAAMIPVNHVRHGHDPVPATIRRRRRHGGHDPQPRYADGLIWSRHWATMRPMTWPGEANGDIWSRHWATMRPMPWPGEANGESWLSRPTTRPSGGSTGVVGDAIRHRPRYRPRPQISTVLAVHNPTLAVLATVRCRPCRWFIVGRDGHDPLLVSSGHWPTTGVVGHAIGHCFVVGRSQTLATVLAVHNPTLAVLATIRRRPCRWLIVRRDGRDLPLVSSGHVSTTNWPQSSRSTIQRWPYWPQSPVGLVVSGDGEPVEPSESWQTRPCRPRSAVGLIARGADHDPPLVSSGRAIGQRRGQWRGQARQTADR